MLDLIQHNMLVGNSIAMTDNLSVKKKKNLAMYSIESAVTTETKWPPQSKAVSCFVVGN